MRKTNIYLNSLIKIDQNELEKLREKIKTSSRNVNQLDIGICYKVVEKIVADRECSQTEALTLITLICQNGGTNRSAGSSHKVVLDGKELSPQQLQNIITNHVKGATIRQLARTLANEIAEIAQQFEIEGDLAAQMRYEYPELTVNEAVWCSNFQTTNPRCPEKVRNWLVKNYKSRFNR